MTSVEFSLVNGSMIFDGEKFILIDYDTRKKRILLAAVISVVLLFVCLNFLRIGDETGSPFHSVTGAVVLIMGIVYLTMASRGDHLKGIIDKIPIKAIIGVDIATSKLSAAAHVRFRIRHEEDAEVLLRKEFRQEEILLNLLIENDIEPLIHS